jgi:hypothetical protein
MNFYPLEDFIWDMSPSKIILIFLTPPFSLAWVVLERPGNVIGGGEGRGAAHRSRAFLLGHRRLAALAAQRVDGVELEPATLYSKECYDDLCRAGNMSPS